MSQNKKTPKNQAKSDHYVNLMLLTVLEAMLLLIGQLIIYNGYAVYPAAIRGAVIPSILVIAAIALVAFVALFIIKKNRTFIKPIIFAAYVVLLMIIMRYIPNEVSKVTGTMYVNDIKGMKIGAITSSIYVLVNFIFLYIKSIKINRKN